jgi:hypothetical protein
MASKLQLWHKFGRFVTGIVIAAFFLPFFGVSCQGMEVITMSGADMVGGCKPGGVMASASNAAEDAGAPAGTANQIGDELGTQDGEVERQPLAIVALALALIGFGLAWVKTRGALVASFVCALAGLGALGGLYVKVSGQMNDAVEQQIAKKKSATDEERIGQQVAQKMDLDAGGRMGLWLTALGMVSIAMLTGLALREKDAIPTATALPPPGPGAG